MKNLLLLIFLLFLSCQQSEQKIGEADEFNYKVVPLQSIGPYPTGPYLLALYEKKKLKNHDWYRAKVFLKNYKFPAGYSDSTTIRFFKGRASFEDIMEGRGINAVVRNDTGYVKFQVFEPNLEKGDSVLKEWEAVIMNPAMPDSIIYTVREEYIIYGR
ncbi:MULTISPECIES: hypothetical protein [Pontibacter]|uniref:Uncharacterized protein n=2 Tax=Pontibacter TaxID=323449 RepID=A0A2U1AV45_9BACT|nr:MULTISPECIES: hypothetical protein [Pontibacter]PVY40270.1 hypothetical protein C8E01_108164 [Pontibacter virosus]